MDVHTTETVTLSQNVMLHMTEQWMLVILPPLGPVPISARSHDGGFHPTKAIIIIQC